MVPVKEKVEVSKDDLQTTQMTDDYLNVSTLNDGRIPVADPPLDVRDDETLGDDGHQLADRQDIPDQV